MEESHLFLAHPVFLMILALAFILSISFYKGIRKNKEVLFGALKDLVSISKPDDHTFVNIGGAVGYHANLSFNGKGPVSEIDATITLLPRQAFLYMPISRLIMGSDRFFITLYMRSAPPGEGHLIEKQYAGFRGPKITNSDRLHMKKVQWGNLTFYLYYEMTKMYNNLMSFIRDNPDPGIVRHIAMLPQQRKGFIFMIPEQGKVATHLTPCYNFMLHVFAN